MPTVYITEQGALLRKKGERFILEKDGTEILTVQAQQVQNILIFGNVQVTTQALSELLEHGIKLSFFTLRGKLKGHLTPPKAKNITLRIAQFESSRQPEFVLSLSREIVSAKLLNGIMTLKDYAHNYPELQLQNEYSTLAQFCEKLCKSESLESLRGTEGAAAALYFRSFARLFRKDLKFQLRKHHPAPDPVNALLSLGYSLLRNEIHSLLEGIGFDPYVGFYHQIDYARPSLALDLLEEFRSPAIDRLTLYLVNLEIVGPEDFHDDQTGGSMRLDRDALKRYFMEYEKLMNKPFPDPSGTGKTTFRQAYRHQAQRLANHIQGKEPYVGFVQKP